jgi:ATP-dependent Lhr-like helicase
VLAERTGLAVSDVRIALGSVEASGFAIRGRFEDAPAGADGEAEQFCDRRLLARIHRYTIERRRADIEPLTAQDFVRFLLRWQHVAPGAQREGRRGVLAVVEQLQGFELAAAAFEEAVLPARIHAYRSAWLDDLCLAGEVAWARLSPRFADVSSDGNDSNDAARRAVRGGTAPSRATPIALAVRADLPWLLAAARGDAQPSRPPDGAAADLLACLNERGALFYPELIQATRRLPVEVEAGLWDLVSRGLVAADGFRSVRTLLGARERWARRTARRAGGRRIRRAGTRGATPPDGRWALLPPPATDVDRDALAEAVAEQLLARWGVVFRSLLARETLAVPWREVVWALRRLEARGVIRGGRFVTGFAGEQYALPDAVTELRRMRRQPRRDELVRVSAADPLNLVGILTPGPRVPAVRTRTVVYRDGLPVATEPLAPRSLRSRP